MFTITPSLPFVEGDVLRPDTLNQWRTDISRAADFTGGSAGIPYTPATVVKLHGAGLELGSALMYDATAAARVSTSPIVNVTTGVVSTAYGNVAASDIATVALDRMPNGATITSVSVYHNRTDSNPLPGTSRVQAGLWKTNILTGVDTAIVAATEDPVNTLPSYEQHHAIVLTPGATETIDTSRYVYWVRVDGESGSNSVSTVLYAPLVDVSVTEQDMAP